MMNIIDRSSGFWRNCYQIFVFYCIIAGIGAGTPQQAKLLHLIFLGKLDDKSETCFIA